MVPLSCLGEEMTDFMIVLLTWLYLWVCYEMPRLLAALLIEWSVQFDITMFFFSSIFFVEIH